MKRTTKKMGATFRAPTRTSVIPCVSVRNVANGRRSVLKFVSLATRTLLVNREEKSFRHVAMVAKFLDDSKPKTALKKWIFALFLIQFHLICQMLANFSGFEPERNLSKFRKGKRRLHLLHKRAREIRKLHVAAVVYVYSNNPQKLSHHVNGRAFLHGGGGPQVVEVTRLSI